MPRAAAEGLVADGRAGAEDFRALVPALRALVRDLSIEIDHWQEGDNWLWAQVSVHAVQVQGTRPICAKGQVMMRFSDGLIREAYNSFDFLSFFEQAGLLPQDVFMLLLSGEKLDFS